MVLGLLIRGFELLDKSALSIDIGIISDCDCDLDDPNNFKLDISVFSLLIKLLLFLLRELFIFKFYMNSKIIINK